MARLKKIIALLIATAVAAAMLTSCRSIAGSAVPVEKSATAAMSTNEKENKNPYGEHMELSVALWSIGEALAEGQDEVRDRIYKKFNIEIKPVNVTWSDYKSKIMIWSASSQLPDMFVYDAVGTTTYKDWIRQGIVKALPDDLSAYPNIKNLMAEQSSSVYRYPTGDKNGRFYAIPRLNHKNDDEWSCDTGIQIRKDWMKNVGVTEDPETMDEFTDLMVKFVDDDPDMNGKHDTIGLTCYDATFLRSILLSYEPCYEGWARNPDNPGSWIPGFMTKNFLKGLQAMHKLYVAGGLDADFATLKAEEGEDKMASGKAGAYSHDVSPATLAYMAGKYEKLNPGKKYEDVVKILKPLRSENGKYYRLVSMPFWSETYFNAKVDDKKMERGMALFDYFLSEDGYNLIHYGIEGKDWVNDNGTVKFISHKDENGSEIPITKRYPFTKVSFFAEWSGTRQWSVPSIYPKLQQMSKAQHEWLMTNAVPADTDLRIGYLDIPSRSKESVQIKDIIINCILSNNVEQVWNDQISSLKENGYTEVIKDTNTAVRAAGIK